MGAPSLPLASTTRSLPVRSVTRKRPFGRKATAHGLSSPVATGVGLMATGDWA